MTFEPVLPDASDEPDAPLKRLRVNALGREINIPRMLDTINQRIEALYDRDHCIGHAYFMPLGDVADGDERFVALRRVFCDRVLPLLEEYFFEDWQKIRLVLADNQKPIDQQFIRETGGKVDELSRLFGGNHGFDSYAIKQGHVVQASALFNPDAYIGIYQSVMP